MSALEFPRFICYDDEDFIRELDRVCKYGVEILGIYRSEQCSSDRYLPYDKAKSLKVILSDKRIRENDAKKERLRDFKLRKLQSDIDSLTKEMIRVRKRGAR